MNSKNGANKFFSIRVTPNASSNKVVPVESSDGSVFYKVYVTAIPDEGKANVAAICAFADFMHLPKSTIKVARGSKSRNKILQVT